MTARAKPAPGELLAAVLPEHPSIAAVRDLLARGADVNETGGEEDSTPLIRAAARDADITKLLLDHGADVTRATAKGVTAFYMATVAAATVALPLRTLQDLLDAGADVNSQDTSGTTPLIIASALGHEGVARWLLERGADPARTRADGATAHMVGSPAVCDLIDTADEIRAGFLAMEAARQEAAAAAKERADRQALARRQQALRDAAPKLKLGGR